MLAIGRNICILFSAGLILLILGCETDSSGPVQSGFSGERQTIVPISTPNVDIKEVEKIGTEKVERTVIEEEVAIRKEIKQDTEGENQEDRNEIANELSTTGKYQDQKYDDTTMPKLHNLGIKNLGPYNDGNLTFGDLLFDAGLTLPIFIEFGATIGRGQSDKFDNPNFEFRGPADTLVISPIDGVVTQLSWQPSAGYVQDDWEVIISPSMRSSWGVSIDHVVSIDCDRKGNIPPSCDKPLLIKGVNLEVGTEVKIGDVIGYMGSWMENGTEIIGRTEITLFQYIENYDTKSIDSVSYCPTLNIAESVEASLKYTVVNLMEKYEMVYGWDSAYDESGMVAPGCVYSTIEENETGGKSIK